VFVEPRLNFGLPVAPSKTEENECREEDERNNMNTREDKKRATAMA
jgi:hypothetical protein